MSTAPRTILMLDEQSVSSFDDVTFHLNPATKHPDNPLLVPGLPHEWDSLQVCWPGTVLHDSRDALFRCWYHGLDALQSERVRREPSVPWEAGYAESADGVHWSKPPLGQSRHHDADTNRLANDFDGWTLSTVFFNPDVNDSRRRFLSIWKTRATFHEPQMPRALASSPDGKSWMLEDPCFYREPPPRHQMQDFWQVLFEPDAPDPDFRVKAYSQYWAPNWDGVLVRQIGLHHGAELRALRDAQPPVVLAPQKEIDEQIHFASVAKFGDVHLMLFESNRYSRDPLHGDLRLAVSADGGRRFRRVHSHSPLVSTGRKGMWDENLLVTTSLAMQTVNDEVRIYYFGCPNVFRGWPGGAGRRGSLFYPTYLGLATLPRDRFAYATGHGTVRIDSVSIGPRGLWLNTDDDIRVTACDASGKIVSTGVAGSERRDTVYRRVKWSSHLPNGEFNVTVDLSGSRLYSIQA